MGLLAYKLNKKLKLPFFGRDFILRQSVQTVFSQSKAIFYHVYFYVVFGMNIRAAEYVWVYFISKHLPIPSFYLELLTLLEML